MKTEIRQLLRESLLFEKHYAVDTSEDALKGEMWDAQGETSQFLGPDDKPEDLFGDYRTPVILPIDQVVTPNTLDGIRKMISKQGKYGEEVMNSLKMAIKNGDPIPPVTVFKYGYDKRPDYQLKSGRHRALASIEMGLNEIPALIMYWRDL